ncbi:hypothetical protein [Arcanobacterium pinnipediorum]|uniref:Uncharacterized protein n=1 Tax=Arcanobacterium pinnipediorum TaxID=1503041 RepID=A0ABY5AF71_9ACTO|nr:hypothetical protein [Arcanobacterium pinnipediorum]USR78864.1 hypothetical protein NG665_05600 [Arcanobacterium pinnipediorum]
MNKAIYAALAKVFAVVLIILGAGATFGGNFAHSYVTEQLSQERIDMPSEEGIARLADKESQELLTPHIGKQLTTGDQAQLFADNYVWQHMIAASDGKTYQEVSGEFMAAKKSGTMSEAEIAKLGDLRETLFMGDTLRGMLLNAYGWWLLGTIAIYAGIALMVLGVVLGILGFGVLRTPKTVSVEK